MTITGYGGKRIKSSWSSMAIQTGFQNKTKHETMFQKTKESQKEKLTN